MKPCGYCVGVAYAGSKVKQLPGCYECHNPADRLDDAWPGSEACVVHLEHATIGVRSTAFLEFVRAQRALTAELQCRPLQQHRTRQGAAERRPQGVVSHGSSPQPTIVEVYTHLPLRAVLRSICRHGWHESGQANSYSWFDGLRKGRFHRRFLSGTLHLC